MFLKCKERKEKTEEKVNNGELTVGRYIMRLGEIYGI